MLCPLLMIIHKINFNTSQQIASCSVINALTLLHPTLTQVAQRDAPGKSNIFLTEKYPRIDYLLIVRIITRSERLLDRTGLQAIQADISKFISSTRIEPET